MQEQITEQNYTGNVEDNLNNDDYNKEVNLTKETVSEGDNLKKDNIDNLLEGQDSTGEAITFNIDELDMPEGLNVDTKLIEDFAGICNEQGLNKEQADAIFTMYKDNFINNLKQGRDDCFRTLQETWKDDYDKKFAHAKLAQSFIDKGLDGRLSHLLEKGLGNEPVFVELLSLIGENMQEDTQGIFSDASIKSERSLEEFLQDEIFIRN